MSNKALVGVKINIGSHCLIAVQERDNAEEIINSGVIKVPVLGVIPIDKAVPNAFYTNINAEVTRRSDPKSFKNTLSELRDALNTEGWMVFEEKSPQLNLPARSDACSSFDPK